MKKVILFIAVLLISGCDAVSNEAEVISSNFTDRKVWVFTQFNVPLENSKIDSYYYYGKISKNLYHKISQNKLSRGFLLLEDVKYWGNDDLIYDYEDQEVSGELVFRIEDIRKIILIKTKPQAGKGAEQFEAQPTENQDAEKKAEQVEQAS